MNIAQQFAGFTMAGIVTAGLGTAALIGSNGEPALAQGAAAVVAAATETSETKDKETADDVDPRSVKLDARDAIRAALAKKPGKPVGVSLETEAGRNVYSVTIDRTEVLVDANTGAVVPNTEANKNARSDGEKRNQ